MGEARREIRPRNLARRGRGCTAAAPLALAMAVAATDTSWPQQWSRYVA